MEDEMTEVERNMASCKHFNGVFVNDACRAGVNYHGLLGRGVGCFKAIPCLKDRDDGHVVCPKREFPTHEEAEREAKETEATMQRFAVAHSAAKADAKRKGWGIGHH
jgi:hypothetical protein